MEIRGKIYTPFENRVTRVGTIGLLATTVAATLEKNSGIEIEALQISAGTVIASGYYGFTKAVLGRKPESKRLLWEQAVNDEDWELAQQLQPNNE